MNLFRAPAARAAKTLDRSLFAKTLNAAAASIKENKLLSKYRKELEKTNEVLFMERFNPILPDPDPSLASQGKKCIVLAPQIKSTCELKDLILYRLQVRETNKRDKKLRRHGVPYYKRPLTLGISKWFPMMLRLGMISGRTVSQRLCVG